MFAYTALLTASMSPHPRAKGSHRPKSIPNTPSFGLWAASISAVDEPEPIPFGSAPMRRHNRTQSARPQQTDVIISSTEEKEKPMTAPKRAPACAYLQPNRFITALSALRLPFDIIQLNINLRSPRPMKSILLAGAAAIALQASGACAQSNPFASPTPPLIQKITEALAGNGQENFIASPLSLRELSAMLALGSAGKTKASFDALLGDYRSFPKNQNDQAFFGASSLWLAPWAELNPQYSQDLANLGAERFTLNGAGPINRWASAKTNGKIREILANVDPSSPMVLANAARFKSAWSSRFLPSDTRNLAFRGAGGAAGAPFMARTGYFGLGSANGYRWASLEYAAGNYCFEAILPPEGTGAITADALQKFHKLAAGPLAAKTQSAYGTIHLPKFKIESSFDLKDAYAGAGMGHIFTDAADFSRMARSSDPLKVGQAVQKAFIEIDENGTEAAAASAASLVFGAAPPPAAKAEIKFDRPFIFRIRETTTGAILFEGAVNRLR